ncbi:hypothetical protein DSB67_01225 [Vibrio campbellii]|nr:hypothetical protein DSB67_01225 [Vibrio campbellii]
MCSLVILSKYSLTKHRTILAEPFGQRLLLISTALSALYQYPTIRCKNQLERSIDPNKPLRSLPAQFFSLVLVLPLPLHVSNAQLWAVW